MRRIGAAIMLIAGLAFSYGLGRYERPKRNMRSSRHVMYYVDPMHPTYRSDKPGIAPDCGMQLEPVFANDPEPEGSVLPGSKLPAGTVRIDETTQRLVGIRLASVERSSSFNVIDVIGRVVPEDTRVYRINSGVEGFIRETFGDSVGTVVRKDQKLATYYAPDFLAAASGFLAANERVPGSVTTEGARSIQNYTDRLRNLGMSDLQIREVASTRKLPESINVLAPADGVVLARNASPGQHFEHDAELYRLADLKKVWVIAEIDEQDQPYLHPGGMAQITLRDSGPQIPARIANSLPESDAGGRTVKLRLEADNPQLLLRPDMSVDVEIPVRRPPALTVPVDALIDSGERARVYVQQGEATFEPREVETGWRKGDAVEILGGLKAGERVVVGATFLVDSESRLKNPQAAAFRHGVHE
jgi:membrane fusion protein, copper/silver efflux system